MTYVRAEPKASSVEKRSLWGRGGVGGVGGGMLGWGSSWVQNHITTTKVPLPREQGASNTQPSRWCWIACHTIELCFAHPSGTTGFPYSPQNRGTQRRPKSEASHCTPPCLQTKSPPLHTPSRSARGMDCPRWELGTQAKFREAGRRKGAGDRRSGLEQPPHLRRIQHAGPMVVAPLIIHSGDPSVEQRERKGPPFLFLVLI